MAGLEKLLDRLTSNSNFAFEIGFLTHTAYAGIYGWAKAGHTSCTPIKRTRGNQNSKNRLSRLDLVPPLLATTFAKYIGAEVNQSTKPQLKS